MLKYNKKHEYSGGVNVKKRIGLVVFIALIAIVVCFLIWRSWPHTFSELISLDEDSVTSFWTEATVRNFESEQSFDDTFYRIDIEKTQNSTLEKILEILNTSKYQQDYRNLLPWDLDMVEPDQKYDGNVVQLCFVWGNEPDEFGYITFLSSGIITVLVGEETEFRVYHPTNHDTIHNLVEYLKMHGTATTSSYQ